MQKLTSREIQKIKKILSNKIKGNLLDIFIIGSILKDKLNPNDLDLIVLFKEKNLKEIEDIFYEIKESLNFISEVHIEPLFVGNMFNESIFSSILHEGFSVKENKFLSDLMNLKSYSIFSFNLFNLSKVDKVRFAQALYGRNKDGLLFEGKGIVLGFLRFMVDVKREEIFNEFFNNV